MRISRTLIVPAALLLAANAGAQKSPVVAATRAAPVATHAPIAALPQGAAAAWNGTPSKWGGSPPQPLREQGRGQSGYAGQPAAYIPIAVAAPYAVPCPVPETDTTYAEPPDASVQMPVVTSRHEDRQLTTIEVYRLQPRFQKP